MRVLFVVHNLCFPPVRGVLQRNYNLIRQASKYFEVHMLAFDQPASRPAGVSAEDCVAELKRFCTVIKWIPILDSPLKTKYPLAIRGLFSGNPYDVNWMNSASMATLIRRELESCTFDLVHFDTIGLAQYLPLVSKVAAVLNHHNIESTMMEQRAKSQSSILSRRYFQTEAKKLRVAEQHYGRKVSINLVVSSEDANTLHEIEPACKSRVIPNGVDCEYFTPRDDPSGKTILFCGGLDWYPNGEAMEFFFAKVWPKLILRQADVKAVIVGRRPPAWLTELSNKDARIKVTGFVDDVRPYFREAAVYFCPIQSGGGTRLKILDALAMGMPLIGTTFSCSGLSLENGKHVLLADTPDAFVDQLVRALNDLPLRLRLANAGREHVVQRFAWQVIGKQLQKVYHEAIHCSPFLPLQGGM